MGPGLPYITRFAAGDAEVAALRRELERCAQDALRTRRTELSLMRERLNAAHPSAGLTRAREALMQQRTSLRAAMQAALVRARGPWFVASSSAGFSPSPFSVGYGDSPRCDGDGIGSHCSKEEGDDSHEQDGDNGEEQIALHHAKPEEEEGDEDG